MTPEEDLMKTVIEAWGQADVRPVFSALDDNVTWISAAARWDERLRSGGIHRGRGNVIALLSKISTAFFNHACTTKEIVSRGEIVWGLFQVASIYAAPSDGYVVRRPVNLEMALRWRIRSGRIIDAQTFFDTAGLLRQLGAQSLYGQI